MRCQSILQSSPEHWNSRGSASEFPVRSAQIWYRPPPGSRCNPKLDLGSRPCETHATGRNACLRESRAGYPWQPGNSALSGGDRRGFAVSQGLDVANWGPAKESPVLTIELARAFVADLERRTCRIQFTREYALPRGMQAKLLLKLQRAHRRKGTKMEVQRGSTHACNRCQVLYPQRLLVV